MSNYYVTGTRLCSRHVIFAGDPHSNCKTQALALFYRWKDGGSEKVKSLNQGHRAGWKLKHETIPSPLLLRAALSFFQALFSMNHHPLREKAMIYWSLSFQYSVQDPGRQWVYSKCWMRWWINIGHQQPISNMICLNAVGGRKKRLDMLVKDILRTEDTPSVCSSYQLVWAVRSNQTHMKEGFPFDRLATAWREVQPCFSGPSLLSVPWPSFARPWPWSRLFAGHLMKMTGPLLVPYSLPWDPAVPTGILHSTLPYALHHAQGQEAIKVFWNKNLKGWKYLDWGSQAQMVKPLNKLLHLIHTCPFLPFNRTYVEEPKKAGFQTCLCHYLVIRPWASH